MNEGYSDKSAIMTWVNSLHYHFTDLAFMSEARPVVGAAKERPYAQRPWCCDSGQQSAAEEMRFRGAIIV